MSFLERIDPSNPKIPIDGYNRAMEEIEKQRLVGVHGNIGVSSTAGGTVLNVQRQQRQVVQTVKKQKFDGKWYRIVAYGNGGRKGITRSVFKIQKEGEEEMTDVFCWSRPDWTEENLSTVHPHLIIGDWILVAKRLLPLVRDGEQVVENLHQCISDSFMRRCKAEEVKIGPPDIVELEDPVRTG